MRSVGLEKKNEDNSLPEVEMEQIRRGQRRLWVSFLFVFVLLCFSVICVIVLLAKEADSDDDDLDRILSNGGLKSSDIVALSTKPKSNEEAQPLFGGSGYWTEKEPMPFARSDLEAIAVEDLIYIIGGLDGNDTVTDKVTIYDTVLGKYTDGPPLPSPLHRFGSAYDSDNKMIYVFGGVSENDEQLDVMYILDVQKEEWNEGPKLIEARSDLCGAFFGGRVYAFGGYSLNYADTLGSAETLTVGGDKWESVKNMTTQRGDCKAAAVSDSILVIGGYYDPTGKWDANSFRSEVEAYIPASDEWQSRAPMLDARGDKAVATLPGDRVLVLGGETHNRGKHTNVALHEVEEYDAMNDVWTQRAPMPYAVFRAGAAHVDGTVFVFGGHPTCDIPDDTDGTQICIELDKLQVYFDFQHPSIFIV